MGGLATSTLALPGSTASTLPEPEPGEDALAALVQDDRWLTEADEDGTPVQKPIRRSGITTAAQAESLLLDLVAEVAPGVTATVTTTAVQADDDVIRVALLADDGDGVSRIEFDLTQPEDDFNFEDVLMNMPECEQSCGVDEHGALRTAVDFSPTHGQKPGVVTLATYQHADGVGVGIHSSNTELHWAEATSTTRAKPLLSAEQLAVIVTSERWLG